MEEKNLIKFGYDERIKNIAAESIRADFSLARVVEVNKNSYIVSDGSHEMFAELTGKFLFEADDPTILPTVGDWVEIQSLNNYTLAIVHSVLPRKTLLKRKEPGKRIDFQLIASNIDFGIIVQSADDINFNLLDRYLVMMNESKIEPITVFSKIDLLSTSALLTLKTNLSKLRNQYLLISNITDNGVEELKKILKPMKTYCLLGQSGVGKTSLLNSMLCEKYLKVNDVREKDGKGRHTTVRRQLLCLDSGCIFIDTPGIRELGNFEIANGIEQTFDEFSQYFQKCRFKDCTHTHEKGCAIIDAVKNGEIEENRYRNYLKLRRESEFYEMSYQEKRKKDKSFGKIVKNYKKYANCYLL